MTIAAPSSAGFVSMGQCPVGRSTMVTPEGWRSARTERAGVGAAHAVYHSADGGQSWTAVVSRTAEQEARLPRSEVAATSKALVLVSVSDGVNAGYALSSEFAITP